MGRSELARLIDHTLLKPTATTGDFMALFEEAVKYGFWSVCIPPSRVPEAVTRLRGTGVRVCTVVGFPLGYSSTTAKLAEAKRAVKDGADEIDMVMNIGAFKSGEFDSVAREFVDISSECHSSEKVLKVIIECCYLTDEEKAKAARLAEKSGADFIKTSTGFGPSGATVRDVSLIHESLTGKAKVKASGGISSLSTALEMVKAGADRLGTSSGARIMEEFAQMSRNP